MYSFVVGALGDPREGDRQGKGNVGSYPGSKPLVGVESGSVVIERIDEDRMDTDFPQPHPADACVIRAVAERGLGV